MNYYHETSNRITQRLDPMELAEKIYRFLKIEDDEIRKVILKKRLDAEFAMKIRHLNSLDKKRKSI